MRTQLTRVKLLFFVVSLILGRVVFAKINFRNQNSTLNILTGGQLTLNTSMTGVNGSVVLPNNLAATISGNSGSYVVAFSNGILQTGNVSAVMNTSLNPTSTDTIALANGDVVDVRSGSVVQAITVANGATATILGQPQFSSAIALGDASSVLQLGITTPLNQNVTGAGTLKLLSDLIVQKNVTLPSLLNLNNNRLVMFGGTYSSALTVSGSGFIDLLGLTTLSAVWTIGAGTYTIVGNGNVLDLGTTGQITFNGTALYLSDVVIKNLSGSRLNGTGTIYLSNVTLDLSGNFTRSDGQFYVQGANCKLITNNYSFTMSGSGNNLTIDGVFFLYEQLNSSITTSPFATASSAVFTKTNGGEFQQIGGSVVTAGIGGLGLSITATSTNLDRNYPLTAAGPMTFVNATPGTPKPMAVDGGGHWLDFPYKSGSFLILQGNVQLNFANTVIKNFYPAGISYGSSATITYGDGVRLELGADLTIASSDVAWTFTGNAEIDGNGATLTINKSQGVTITNAKTLTLKNMRIVTSTVDAFKCLSSTAKIKLQNVDLVLTAAFNFSAGSLDIADLVRVFADTGAAFSALNFEFSSSGLMTVTNSAELFIGSGVNFKYNADPTGAANFAATKRKFLLSQLGSRLTLQDCSLETTNTGLAFDQGTVRILDKVTIVTTANSYAQLEIAYNTNFNIASGATLILNGLVNYSESLPLNYGDIVVLQHANYGYYLACQEPNLGRNTYGNGSITAATKWYVEPGDFGSRFGTGKVGNPVLSGDFIKLETAAKWTAGSWNSYEVLLTLTVGGAPVSTPNPPYFGLGNENSYAPQVSGDPNEYQLFRIYKKGGTVGSPIFVGDPVYIYAYPIYGSAGMLNKYHYVGGSNFTTGLGSETFGYQQSGSSAPSNLTSNLTWTVAQNEVAAYLTALTLSVYYSKTDPQVQAVTVQWPSASLTQF